MVARVRPLCLEPPATPLARQLATLLWCPSAACAGLRHLRIVALLPLGLLVGLAAGGCKHASSSSEHRRGPTANTSSEEDQLILSLADNLNHLEEFEADKILPQIRHRLDQWVEHKKPNVDWQRDPLIETLPEPLRGLRSLASLDKEKFSESDMLNLREAVWLRDVARHARGNELDDLSIARRLFDWTVRNLQLDEEAALAGEPTRRLAYEVLQSGRATASERTWVFLLLLRQQGLEGVVLGIADPQTHEVRPWAPALVTDKELFVFDPELGLPIAGPDGRPVATLTELAADDSLLRKLDLSSQRKYPLEAGQLKDLVAYVEASPSYLTRRMKLVETKLTGQNKVVLSTSPQQTAERLAAQPLIAEVRYWPYPFAVAQSRALPINPEKPPIWWGELLPLHYIAPLRRARALQFKGEFDGEKGAKAYYLKSRRSDDSLAKAPMSPQERALWIRAKQDASYWLGLIAYEQQGYPVAVDYLARRTLELSPGGPWTEGARYNLARTYEQSGQLDKAIDLLQSDSSPQKHGNRLRARRLKAELANRGETEPDQNPPADDSTAAE